MKTHRIVAVLVSLGFSLLGSSAVAQSTNSTPPVIIEKGRVPIPPDIQSLVKTFEAERSAYLTEQKALLAKLAHTTNPDERAAIRQDLEDNTADFLADLKEFRTDLKQEIEALKGKLNNPELARLIAEVKHEIETHNHHAR